MFTGIIEELGTVEDLVRQTDAARIRVHAPQVTQDASRGDSIAVNGCCLTVAELGEGTFTADVMRETLSATSLGGLAAGARVNLERAATPTSRLGGHIVQGHVDATATVRNRIPGEHWEVVQFDLPVRLARYLVAKGSVAVDGVSLTVVEAQGPPADPPGAPGWFSVSLIPETLARTTLGLTGPGDPVNLEVDVIAKYVEKMVRSS